MEIHRSDFPEDMVFGAATASYQIEGSTQQGGRGPSNWDEMIRTRPGPPEGVENGDTAKMACKSYYYYKEDVKLAKHMGLDAYRFSISWTRILPGGRLSAGVNKEGIEYYNKLIDEVLANGIVPYVTIHHFEVPQVLEEEYGGFLSDNIVDDFLEFAELCFWEFGDRVKHWITFNEPWTFILFGYVKGTMPPNRGSSSEKHAQIPHPVHKGCNRHSYPLICDEGDPGTEPYIVARNLLIAHAETYNLYKTKFKSQGGKIGITLVTQWYEPLTDSEADKVAAQRQLDFAFGWFMDPITFGQYPQNMLDLVPKERLQPFSDEESAKLKGTYDFLGLNYYTGAFALDAPSSNSPPSYLTDPLSTTQSKDLDGNTIGLDTGSWVYTYPIGLYNLLCYIKKNYNDPPIYITENGTQEANDITKTVAEARVDPIRIQYHTEHLKEVKHAMKENRVNVKGYFIWSLMDNFEWTAGFQDRFGLVYVEFRDEDKTRYPKNSALWYMNFLDKKPRILDYRRLGLGFSKPNAIREDDANQTAIVNIPPGTTGEIVVAQTPSKRPRNA